MSDSQDENASLDEIRQLLPELPGPDMDAGTTALQHQTKLTKPAGSLGRLEELAVWLATWQGRGRPSMDRPRVAVFAGNHGITEHGVSAYPASVTEQMVQNFINGGAAVNQLAGNVGADLRVYEMALDQPTGDFTQGPAMNEEDCALALSYGMMSVEEGFDVMAVGEMGIGNTTAAAALCCGLFGGEPSSWVGSGTGVDEAGLTRKAEVVAAGLAANEAEMTDPFEILRCLGGLELAAIAGAILACRMGRIPVVLDGFACTAAAAVLQAADSRTLDHCIVGHQSVEPGHARLLEILGKKPLMDLDMRLGEASGATLGIQVLQSAVACHIGMATFEEAGVSGPVEG